MSHSDDFAAALARVHRLMDGHPRHHPSVRVALAEALASLEPGPMLTWRVTSDGLAGSAGVVPGTAGLAVALERAGVATVEVQPDVTGEELEAFLAEAREKGAPPPPASSDVPEAAGLARSVAALFGGPAVLADEERPETGESGPSTAPPGHDGPRPDPPPVVQVEPAHEPDTLSEALDRFTASPDPRLVDRILELAADEDPDALVDAVILCVESSRDGRDPRVGLARRLATPEVLRLLANRLPRFRDPEWRARHVRVSVALESPMARTLGAALAEAQDRSARRCYIDALVSFGPAGLQTVLEMVADPRWYVVRNGVRLLPDVAGRGAVQPLTRAMRHPDPRVRREAITSLSRVGGPQVTDRVLKALDDDQPDVRSAAARAVGLLGGAEAGLALSRQLDQERDPNVAVNLIRSLARVGHTDAVPQLGRRTASRLFSRTPKPVRIAALQALWSLGTPSARSAVMQALDDRDPDVRGSVRSLLGGR